MAQMEEIKYPLHVTKYLLMICVLSAAAAGHGIGVVY